jgi:FtsH-binding integral membrane protein
MYNESYSSTVASPDVIDQGLRSYMIGVYNKMALALVVTAVTAWWGSTALLPLMKTPFWYAIIFAPLVAGLALTFFMNKLSNTAAYIGFMIYAVLMGASLSSIFVVYTGVSIAKTFFISAATFAAASLYGYTTGRDLTSMGSFLIMGVIGICIASIVNIFLASSMLAFIISIVGVIAFTGLTAYDTQKLKEEYLSNGEVYGFDSPEKSSIFGALTLYLDAVNIFISLLQLLGDKKND